jgi:alpha-glucosidase (family GH31 glycosyl hydrolase)
VEIVITAASPLTTRISVLALDGGQPQTIPDDGALANRRWPTPAARIRALAPEQTIKSGTLTVRLSARRPGEAVALQITGADGRAVQRLGIDAQTGALSFATGAGPLLGLGQGGPQFDRRGVTLGARSGQGAYQLRTHGGRVPVQWLVDTSGGALFVHQPMGTFDLTGSDGRFSGSDGAPVLPLDLFIVGAHEPAAIMTEYARLTGYPELPPLWSLGYQQSHRTLASRAEVLEEAKTFREKKLPCDTLIYLGTGFCPSGWNTDNGEFTFNPNVFPDPKAMIDQLHDDHFNVVLHIVLEG